MVWLGFCASKYIIATCYVSFHNLEILHVFFFTILTIYAMLCYAKQYNTYNTMQHVILCSTEN